MTTTTIIHFKDSKTCDAYISADDIVSMMRLPAYESGSGNHIPERTQVTYGKDGFLICRDSKEDFDRNVALWINARGQVAP